jgi:hypothetical protein
LVADLLWGEVAGQLAGKFSHAQRWGDNGSLGHHLEIEGQETGTTGQLSIQKNAAEKGVEEVLADLGGEPVPL